MGQTILTQDQKTVLRLFSEETSLNTFYLSGGTALAEYYLQHRDSDDLDFFSDTPIDISAIEFFIQKLTKHLEAKTARFERIHDRRVFFIERKDVDLKIEFSLYPFSALEKRKVIHNIQIDSKRDIAANKLAALLDRFEPKDFVDLYFLLQDRMIENIRSDVEKKFGLTVSSLALGGELAKVRRVEILPRMRVPFTIDELKKFFMKLAEELKPTVLDY